MSFVLPIIISCIIIGMVWVMLRLRKSSGSFQSDIDMVSKYNRRSTDKKSKYSSASVRKVVNRAEALAAKGNFIEAASVYQSIDMPREAIDILEKNDLVAEAAAILLNLGSYQRAGALFARNKHFSEAAKAYIKANNHKEAAYAARSGNDYILAGQLFDHCRDNLDAAKCYLRAKKFLLAGRCYGREKLYHKCATCYNQHLKVVGLENLDIQKNDQKNIYQWFLQRRFSKSMMCFISGSDYFFQLIDYFHQKDDKQMCVSLLAYGNDQDLNQVITKINFDKKAKAQQLASYFSSASKQNFAEIILARFGDNRQASQQYQQDDIQSSPENLSKKADYSQSQSEPPKEKLIDTEPILVSVVETDSKVDQDVYYQVDQSTPQKPLSNSDVMYLQSVNYKNLNNSINKKDQESSKNTGDDMMSVNFDPTRSETIEYSSEFTATAVEVLEDIPKQNKAPEIPLKIDSSESPPKEHRDYSEVKVPAIIHKSCTKISPPRSFYLCSLLVDLNRMECEELWNFGLVSYFEQGITVCSKNNNLKSYIVVLEGILYDNQNHKEYSPSSSFGELSILSDHQINMSVETKSQAQLFVLERSRYEKFCISHPKIAVRIFKSYIMGYLSIDSELKKSS